MTATVISTNTTLTVTLTALGDSLTVLSSGSIVAPTGIIDGSNLTQQSVTIAGFVDVAYIWLAGNDHVVITASGTFFGHSPQCIFVGVNILGNVETGSSTIDNFGLIIADHNAIQMFGTENQILNAGQIEAENRGVWTASAGVNAVINSGAITSRADVGVQMDGTQDSLANSGSVTALAAAVSMSNAFQSVVNSGTIRSSEDSGIAVSGDGGEIYNYGEISSTTWDAVDYVGFQAVSTLTIANTGLIAGVNGIVSAGESLTLHNSGRILGVVGTGVYSLNSDVGVTKLIINTGLIAGVTNAVALGAEQDTIRNSGTLAGSVVLGDGNDLFDTRGGIVQGSVYGGLGSDTYIISDASVDLYEGAGNLGDVDTLKSTVSVQLATGFEVLTLLGGNDLKGSGNGVANTLNGNSGDNRVNGLEGGDTITGQSGDDTLLGNAGADQLSGGDGNDRLLGGADNDRLTGGDGDDVLIGGGGRDNLGGGTGADVFIFLAPGDTAATQALADTITDFNQGDDLIDLSRLDAKSGNANSNDAFAFVSGGFSNVAGQLHAVQVAGNTYVEYDLNGDSVADGVIKLTGLYTLSATDFTL